MANYGDYELVPPSESIAYQNEEEQNLLPSSRPTPRNRSEELEQPSIFRPNLLTNRIPDLRSVKIFVVGYAAGVLSVLAPVLVTQFCWTSLSASISKTSEYDHPPYGTNTEAMLPSFPADIGSTQIHYYPPASPTNGIPSLFPTQVGYPGPTATGAEPGLVMTAGEGMYPTWRGVEGLVRPVLWDDDSSPDEMANEAATPERPVPDWIEDGVEGSIKDTDTKQKSKFDIFRHWGNLTPFYSIPSDSFGSASATSPDVPNGCTLKGVHILHRHGARYPTADSSYAAPGRLASKLHTAASSSTGIKAHSPLSFLNTWTYKLGTDVLTPFGRQQLFDLGVSMRVKYGSLLEGFTNRLPVFRTESEDRMLASAANFAFGFFGWPLEDKFLLSVTIEETGFNNTLVPDKVCPNAAKPAIGDRGTLYVKRWVGIYLLNAHMRIQGLLEGVQLTLEDIYAMQMMCAYETTALGYSKFCGLFTEEEWEGFEYSLDLSFWYGSGFGSPTARALGSGYVLELLSRLTHTPISPTSPITANPSTFSVNLTLDTNPITFPLDQPIYVDATHDTVIANILTALNLTSLAGEDGPLSWKKMRRKRNWIASKIVPFASNMCFQVLECSEESVRDSSSTQIRFILNDAVVALNGVSGCPEHEDGLCPLDTFVRAEKKLIEGSDWDWTCYGDWTVPEGDAWWTMTGDPPDRP